MTRRSSIAPIPPGALDLAGDAVRRRRILQGRMFERLEAAGFQEIIPPTFEYAEVFVRAGGGAADVADRLIRFLDLDGKLLALRYDFTASVARLAPDERAAVRRLIDRKDAAGLAAVAPGALTELPFIIGRREALDRAARVMATGPAPNDAIARLHAIDAALSDSERRHVVYDFGEVRGLDYYTGIHFEIFVAGAGTAVGAGGRYDDPMGRLGRPPPAVGLALDLDALATAAP